ncbi:hydrogenase expression/formation protein HypE [Stetteria hydrogenophila]
MVEKWRLAVRSLLTPRLLLSHGGGGRETSDVVEKLIRRLVPRELWKVGDGTGLDLLDDAALVPVDGGRVAVTVDSYTVDPIFFPGGDLGLLAASGTINDLLMVGARPVAALDAIIAEEGLEVETLARVVNSMVETFKANGVALIGGDFKVLPKGSVDKLVITTVGIGTVVKPIRDDSIKDGDKIIVSGYVGVHGAAILSARQAFGLKMEVKSDVKPLTDLMLPLIEKYGDYIHAAGDPTRGGVAMLLNDWASKNGLVIVVDDAKIPVTEEVMKYSEVLGIDPLSLANEGAAVLAVDPAVADEVVEFMKSRGYEAANIIGEARAPRDPRHKGIVLARTRVGGFRIIEPPSGEIVPRIC